MHSLRQLEYLITVVDTGSFTRAAAQLHVTQPALSHQIRALEGAVGGALLERLPRAVRLTLSRSNGRRFESERQTSGLRSASESLGV